jgi:uncharacterized membrane protein
MVRAARVVRAAPGAEPPVAVPAAAPDPGAGAAAGDGFDPGDDPGADPGRPPRWPWLAGTALSILGLGVSGYLTYEHYTGSTTLSCPAGSARGYSVLGLFTIPVNCFKVTTSIYSNLAGVPVAVLGLAFFVVMLILQSPWLWRSPKVVVRAVRLTWCLVGLATAFKLIYDEIYRLDAVCLWCTSVHLITFVLLATTAFGTVSAADYFAGLDPAHDGDNQVV